MLLFSAALQYLPPNEVIPGLTEHHHVIMEEIAESAILMVTTNDVLLGTLEGLENIILEGLFHVDCGNIRRAWIAMRRAVMAAQLLGLDRPGHERFKVINDKNDLDPEIMWGCITSMERVLSLLLGLPSSTHTSSSVLLEGMVPPVQGISLHTLMMDVTPKILERNLITAPQQALNVTREIDRELLKMTERMPSRFWRPPAFAGLEIDSVDAFWETRRTWDQMCYYTLVNQLHLPFMLCPSHAPENVYSRIACVNASREILLRQIAIRTFNSISACCRMGDFLALIAGMTLVLAHLVSHGHKETENLLAHQRLADRATVERTLESMKSMSELHKDVLAAKCAALLKDLLVVEADAARAQNYRADKPTWINGAQEDDCNVLVIKVPYMGATRITRGGITSMAPFKIAQDRDLREVVTIGGIGSLHVNSPRFPEHTYGYDTSDTATRQAASAQGVNAIPNPQQATDIEQAMSGNLFLQQDQVFPDAAASLDDWVFQGFDTAFFDVLMRGAGDQQPNDAGVGQSDISTFN